MLEDIVTCGKCKQKWAIKTHKKGFVKGLAMVTGYMCSECSGEDPKEWNDPKSTMFPARKVFDSD